MKAWVIKTKTGYAGHVGNKHKLNEAFLYPTERKALKDWNEEYSDVEGDEVIPVEIELIKTGYEHVAKVLLEKLTSEELASLCDAYDDGSIETIFMDVLLPKDVENRPSEYAEPNDDDDINDMEIKK